GGVWKGWVEGGEELERLSAAALAREEAAVGLDDAQRGRVELVGALEVFRGVLLLAGNVEDQRGMQLLEDRIPIRAGELVDGVGRLLRFGRVCHRPGRQQRCGKIGDRSANGLGELPARSRVLLLLDRPHSKDEPRDAIVLVDLQNALGELDPLLNLSIGKYRQEGAAEEFVVAGIAAQRGTVIGRRRGGVALAAGVASGELAAGRRGAGEAVTRLLRASAKHGWPGYDECSRCGHGRTPQRRRKDHGLSTPSGGRKPQAATRLGEWDSWPRALKNSPHR